jgi:hypothetical protein
MASITNTAVLASIPQQIAEVGPFPGNTFPARVGVYRRVSAKSGRKVWSFWNGRTWGLYSATSIERAISKAKSKKPSKKALPWFGLSGEVK